MNAGDTNRDDIKQELLDLVRDSGVADDPEYLGRRILELGEEFSRTSALESSPSPGQLHCAYRPDMTVIAVNDACAEQLGRTPSELIGRKWTEFLPNSECAYFCEQIAGLSPESPRRELEYRIRLSDSSIDWQRWINHGIFDDAGRLMLVECFSLDAPGREPRKASVPGRVRDGSRRRSALRAGSGSGTTSQRGHLRAAFAGDMRMSFVVILAGIILIAAGWFSASAWQTVSQRQSSYLDQQGLDDLDANEDRLGQLLGRDQELRNENRDLREELARLRRELDDSQPDR